eukprot:gene2726-4240_t
MRELYYFADRLEEYSPLVERSPPAAERQTERPPPPAYAFDADAAFEEMGGKTIAGDEWKPPPLKQLFENQYYTFDKPLLVIVDAPPLNASGGQPRRFSKLPLHVLKKMIESLTKHHTVVFARVAPDGSALPNPLLEDEAHEASSFFAAYDGRKSLFFMHDMYDQAQEAWGASLDFSFQTFQLWVYANAQRFVALAGGPSVLPAYLAGSEGSVVVFQPADLATASAARIPLKSAASLSRLSGADVTVVATPAELLQTVRSRFGTPVPDAVEVAAEVEAAPLPPVAEPANDHQYYRPEPAKGFYTSKLPSKSEFGCTEWTDHDNILEFHSEFGMEFIIAAPYAYYLHTQCKRLSILSVKDTKAMYFFADDHKTYAHRSRKFVVNEDFAGFPLSTIHVKQLPTQEYTPPPYKSMFKNSFFVFDKPILVITNKFQVEWGGRPINHIPLKALITLVNMLRESYTIVYSRPTSSEIEEDGSKILDYPDKERLKGKVLLIEDMWRNAQEKWGASMGEDLTFNLFQFWVYANADKFISVQGGNSALTSFMAGEKGTVLVYVRAGKELQVNAIAGWYGKFSNASLHEAHSAVELQRKAARLFLSADAAKKPLSRLPLAPLLRDQGVPGMQPRVPLLVPASPAQFVADDGTVIEASKKPAAAPPLVAPLRTMQKPKATAAKHAFRPAPNGDVDAFYVDPDHEGKLLGGAHCKKFEEHSSVLDFHSEFGMELIIAVPYVYYLRTQCITARTRGTKDTASMYFWSDKHQVKPLWQRAFSSFEKFEGFPLSTVHVDRLPATEYTPPPYKQAFMNKYFVYDKPLLVITNKYQTEWGGNPVNFIPLHTLKALVELLIPHYTVVYSRPTNEIEVDKSEMLQYGDKKMLSGMKGVLLIEDLWVKTQADLGGKVEGLSFNLFQFWLYANADRFISVQGGNSVLTSYMAGSKGTVIVYIQAGKEMRAKSIKRWYGKFSGATVFSVEDPDELYRQAAERFVPSELARVEKLIPLAKPGTYVLPRPPFGVPVAARLQRWRQRQTQQQQLPSPKR